MKARKIRTIRAVQDWLISIEARDPWRWQRSVVRQIRIQSFVRAQYAHHLYAHHLEAHYV